MPSSCIWAICARKKEPDLCGVFFMFIITPGISDKTHYVRNLKGSAKLEAPSKRTFFVIQNHYRPVTKVFNLHNCMLNLKVLGFGVKIPSRFASWDFSVRRVDRYPKIVAARPHLPR